ncbi:diacylglycerol kinase [Candidatus Saccharibacteria bacterium SW_7_54_9]|nr:MAG: diacylglycerol kinase [Candidatus Saccharibacteria bacterium SW_7_54_9]
MKQGTPFQNRQTRTNSFRVAASGLVHTARSQPNFQLQIVAGLIVLAAAVLFGFSRMEWLVLIITLSLVLVAELLNTVVEIVVDLAVKERLIPEAKLAKDVSAAAVLLTSFFALVTGVILFAPHLWSLAN